MKRTFLAFGLILGFFGCDPGPAGPTGPPGTGIQDFNATFKEGTLPYSGWTGTLFHWVDASAPTSVPGTGEIVLKSGATLSAFSRGLLKFNVSGAIPSNATISGAVLQLTTKTATSLPSGSHILGVHNASIPAMASGGCSWTSGASWDDYNGSISWGFCTGAGNPSFTRGVHYVNTAMDTLSVNSTTVNGNTVLLAWNLDTAVVQDWVANPSNNLGMALSFETETGLTSGNITFWDNTGSDLQKPTLVVNYYIP